MKLECFLTPTTFKNKLAIADNVVAVASLVGQAAILLHPASLAITIITKAYETIRGYQKISDNVKRGVSTNLNKNVALAGNVISLTSSVITLGAYMKLPAGKSLPVVSIHKIEIFIFNFICEIKILILSFCNFRQQGQQYKL